MRYGLVVDSCCDLTRELCEKMQVIRVPLTIRVDGKDFVDDEKLNMEAYDAALAVAQETVTACPPPDAYQKAYEACYQNGAQGVFVITLSAELSGSYQCAHLAARLFTRDGTNGKKVYVLNSKSAAAGEVLLSLLLYRMIQQGLGFEQIAKRMEEKVKKIQTLFLLQNLGNLHRAGRLSLLQERVLSMLKIKPICTGTPEGTIALADKALGMSRALRRLGDLIAQKGDNGILCIVHHYAEENTQWLVKYLKEHASFSEYVILSARGLSGFYEDRGGIVTAFLENA